MAWGTSGLCWAQVLGQILLVRQSPCANFIAARLVSLGTHWPSSSQQLLAGVNKGAPAALYTSLLPICSAWASSGHCSFITQFTRSTLAVSLWLSQTAPRFARHVESISLQAHPPIFSPVLAVLAYVKFSFSHFFFNWFKTAQGSSKASKDKQRQAKASKAREGRWPRQRAT